MELVLWFFSCNSGASDSILLTDVFLKVFGLFDFEGEKCPNIIRRIDSLIVQYLV